MTRSTLSILSVAGLAAAQFACSPISYGVAEGVELEVVLTDSVTFDIFTDMETPPPRDRQADKGNLPSTLSVNVKTLDPDAAYVVDIYDGDELIATIDSALNEIWISDLEDYEDAQTAYLTVSPLYKGCHWDALCSRDLELVVSGLSAETVEIDVVIGMSGGSRKHLGLDDVVASIEVVAQD